MIQRSLHDLESFLLSNQDLGFWTGNTMNFFPYKKIYQRSTFTSKIKFSTTITILKSSDLCITFFAFGA